MKYTLIWLLVLLFSIEIVAQERVLFDLEGKVIDNSTGEPILNVSVTIDSLNKFAVTDQNGIYILSNIPTGNYQVLASTIGYKDQVKTIQISNASYNTINFNLEDEPLLLKEIVITATRTERNAEDVPIPVTVISKEQIENMGSIRLSDVLNEQTGLTLISDHGTGIQLQGYDSDYTLIMVNGQPLIGRTAGTFDLDRVTINNIKQIEITKGPSSSLYGNEALAGVINIITEDTNEPFNVQLATKYRTYNTSDISLNTSGDYKKVKASLQLNRYSSSGYDLTPETISRTAPKFSAYTLSTQLTYKLNKKVKLRLQGRLYNENQENKSLVTENDSNHEIDVDGNQNDWSIAPTLILDLTPKVKMTAVNYTSGYNTKSDFTYNINGNAYDHSFFKQLYNRSDFQADFHISEANVLTTGGGFIIESLNSDRYAGLDDFYTRYAFLQNEWTPFSKRLIVTVGGRFDSHSEYSGQLSPKLAVQYKTKKWLTVRGALGTGFKSPDFRQLFLNFTNPTVGYSVLGSTIVEAGMKELEASGQIQNLLMDYTTINAIKAESSTSYNFGFDLKPKKNIKLRFNFFRNDIKNLIESAPIAIKTNGQQVFSYFNLNNVFTQGVESSFNCQVKKNIKVSLGYQYLEAKDKGVIEKLNEGNVFARDENNQVVRVKPSQYGGLFNRSKHSGNAKIFYKNIKHKFNVNVRTVYRGSYGFGDVNSNGILDAESEYVDGFFTWYFSASKNLLKEDKLTLQMGVDNIFSNTNKYIPTMPGRLIYVGARFHFTKADKNKDLNNKND